MSRGSISNFRRIKNPKLLATQSDTSILTHVSWFKWFKGQPFEFPSTLCSSNNTHRTTIYLPSLTAIIGAGGQYYHQHWAEPTWTGFWAPAYRTARQKSDRREEIGTLFHAAVHNSEEKDEKFLQIQFLLIISFSYSPAPATIFSFRYVSPILQLISCPGFSWVLLEARKTDIKRKGK